MMTPHQRETEFLKQCIRYDDTEERHRLEERITRIQQDERIVRRAVWLMALLAALAMAGLAYAGLLMGDYLLNLSQFTGRFLVKSLCALGGGSIICLFVFLGFGAVLRKELDQRREDCRRLALKVLESRLGQPQDLLACEIAKNQEIVKNGNGAVRPAAEMVQPAGSVIEKQPFSGTPTRPADLGARE